MTGPAPDNPYLSGGFAPVAEEQTVGELPVTGTIPPELDGRYLRNGPNPVAAVDPAAHHWFVGTGMIHGVRLRAGRAEWYRNRWVVGDEAASVLGREPLAGHRHPLFAGSAPNTNVVASGSSVLAVVEAGGAPVELDEELGSLRYHDFAGTWTGPFTAHPKRDPATGELHALCYDPMLGDDVAYVVVGSDGSVRHSARIGVGAPVMVHDTAVTETSVLVLDLPVTLSADALAAGAPLPYRWNPDRAARIGVLPLGGTAEQVRWCEVDPCYVFHPLNAHDLPDGRIVLDAVRHPTVFARDLRGPNDGPPTLDRWVLDPATGRSSHERLDERGQEFPRVDERRVGRAARWGYTVGYRTGDGGPDFAGVLRHDLVAGTSQAYALGPQDHAGEMVFVPRAPDAAEEDGWLVGFVHDTARGATDLVVLPAGDPEHGAVARVHLPCRVPFGFHGNWFPTP